MDVEVGEEGEQKRVVEVAEEVEGEVVVVEEEGGGRK